MRCSLICHADFDYGVDTPIRHAAALL